jgi:hypothetical protein
MVEQIKNAIEIIKKQDIDGCITGSCLLDYYPGQDIDIFVYNKSSFNKLLFFMYYNPMFTILDPLEKHKFDEYINDDKSSLDSIGLITIKMKYNLCVDVNVVYKKFHHNIFDVISNFDLDIIATGYDIKTTKTLSLRETSGMKGTWNRFNQVFYKKNDFWSVKRVLRQFDRVIKYTERGYDLSEVTDKYIEIVEENLRVENYYKSEKGNLYFDNTMKQFEVVLKILQAWKVNQKITPEELLTLRTLI